ncbi:MAG TPA: hypothetical protein VE860_16620 [Chthoniobacterales bacterium]|nr:hypothetical protein [Chthoniobacterales bacterium]
MSYPAHVQTRRVSDAGDISWHKSRVFISEVLRGEDIGLERVEENFYRIYFCNLELGEFDVNHPPDPKMIDMSPRGMMA